MRKSKRFIIDVEEEYQENAVFFGEEFLCFEDDSESLVSKLNEQQATIKSKDKQLERLYNYFQDYLKDEMSGNAFSEMWDFVKEDESWEDETIYC